LKEASTYHIHLTGIVQGVGFRPYVYNFAIKNDLQGYVCNSADGVHIEFNANEKRAGEILKQIVARAPDLSRIETTSLQKVNKKTYKDFSIRESESNTAVNMPLTPDFALCEDCRKELHDSTNRRYQFPLISCTKCGPRYSIINKLPYDRENTSLEDVEMCGECYNEFHDYLDRRYYSQINACPECSVSVSFIDSQSHIVTQQPVEVIKLVTGSLKQGKIIAVKGIGGYLLLCDASNSNAVQLLRQRKKRPAKPFAVMFTGISQLKLYAHVDEVVEQLLSSPVSPVVLVQSKRDTSLALNEIAPGLDSLGVMIPYTPLFDMILDDFAMPVVATSGNTSNSPVIFNDSIVIEQLLGIADCVVTHDRIIVMPQDDSVVRLTTISREPIILRRSRGMAPSYFGYVPDSDENMVATGALMKSSFTLSHSKHVYISQYLGNTDSYDTQQSYQKVLSHLSNVLNAKPGIFLTDKHPHYFSHELAETLARKYNTELYEVQHHKAHFAAVLAENKLLGDHEDVLGVIWDGTGLGDDGQVWGGEFFHYHHKKMYRHSHFDYFPSLLGDKMAKEPRLSALSASYRINGADDLLRNKFTDAEWGFYRSLLKQDNLLECSSVGRIFDAVASILGICDRQSYEGEAAMLLEAAAQRYCNDHGYDLNESYLTDEAQDSCLSVAALLSDILQDSRNGGPVDFIAAKFHYSLAKVPGIVAENIRCRKIAFSGGVFQNALLVDMIQHHSGGEYELFFHKELSPNDENISFGQMVYYDSNIDNSKKLNSNSVMQTYPLTCQERLVAEAEEHY